MANENKVTIIIDANGNAAIESFNKITGSMKNMETETGGIVSKIKEHWLALSAAAVGAFMTIQKGWHLAEQAAAYEEQMASLNALAGQYNMTGSSIVQSIKEASQGLISMSDAARIAGTALMKEMRPEQIIKLAEAAEVLSNVTGEKVPRAFENLTGAIALGRERALEASVGIIDLNAKYGDLVSKMSDAEKANARYAMVMEKVEAIKQRLGGAIDSNADKMDRLKVTVQDLQLHLGTVLIRAALGAVGAFQWLAAGALNAFGGLAKLMQGLGWLTDKLGITESGAKHFGEIADTAFAAAQEQAGKAANNFSAMIAKSSDFATAAGKIKPPLDNVGNAASEAAKKIADLNKQLQDMIDKATLSPVALIEKQSEAWLKAGANRILVEKWVTTEMEKLNREHLLKIIEQNEQAEKEEFDALKGRIQEEIKYDEFMRGEAEKNIQRQEELHKRQMEIIQEEKDMKLKAYEETWQKYFDMTNQVGGELGKGLGMMGTGLKGITDIAKGTDPYTAEYNRTAEHYAALIQLKIDKYGEEANIDAEWQAIMTAQEQMNAQQRIATYQNMAAAMAGTMYSMYVAAGSHNKAMFTMYKAFAITEAIISTYAGAARALKDFSFPYSIAVAAIVTAAGIARVAAIAAQKPGGTATAAAPSGGGGYSYSQPTTPTWEKEEEKPKSQVINVYVSGNIVDHDAFARELVPAIQKAVADGAH